MNKLTALDFLALVSIPSLSDGKVTADETKTDVGEAFEMAKLFEEARAQFGITDDRAIKLGHRYLNKSLMASGGDFAKACRIALRLADKQLKACIAIDPTLALPSAGDEGKDAETIS